MNKFIIRISKKLKYNFIHPQWIANTNHKRKLESLSEINNSLVLDIGSGDSHIEDYISSDNRLLKIDYLNTNKRYDEKPDIYADASSLPLKSQSVDIIIIFEVLEHLKDSNTAFDEIYRVLKPSGILYISVPFTYPLHDLPYDYRRYTPFGLEHKMRSKNLTVVHSTKYPSHLSTLLYLINMYYLSKYIKIYSKKALLKYPLFPLVFILCLLNNIASLLSSQPNDNDTLFLSIFIKASKV